MVADKFSYVNPFLVLTQNDCSGTLAKCWKCSATMNLGAIAAQMRLIKFTSAAKHRESYRLMNMPVEIKSIDEPWVNITLADGSSIKMRLIIFGVEAVYDDNGNHMMTPDGQLAYGVKYGMIFNVTSSPHLLIAARQKMQAMASGIEGVKN